MTPLVVLATGLSMLLACGAPAFRHARIRMRRERHLEARLETLHPAAERAASLAIPARRGTIDAAAMPRALRIALARADIALDWRMTILATAGTLLCAALLVATCGVLYAGILLIIIGVILYAVFRIVTNRRLAAFIDGLPAYLDGARQLIMVGNSLQQSLVKAGESCNPGVARHIGSLLRRIQFGAPPAESILWLAERLDVIELHMLAAVVQTNARYGGRISTVLANLTGILRDRARIDRELRSATAETRMSGMVLAALPVCVAALVTVFNPTYMRFFIDTHQGRMLILGAAGMEVAGVLVMRRIMRIDF